MSRLFTLPLTALLLAGSAHAASLNDATVTRSAPGALTVSWDKGEKVDVFMSTDAAATPDKAKLVSKQDRNGTETIASNPNERVYFLLRDSRSGETVRVAERVLPLQQSSNFRDIGGYPAADGKHVRWAMVYRSGGQPMLTDTDLSTIRSLKLASLVDLRSNEERAIAPTRIDGVPYQAVGYSMMTLMKSGPMKNGEGVYRTMPSLIAPQLRLVFQDLLANRGPIAYNCSAGQDRTGFVTAMILSALGVPRDTIVKDYHLSTPSRRPEWEMPKIDTVANAGNPVAMMFARYQSDPAAAKPQPLQDPDGTPFLNYAFDEIEKRWGSVDGYLEQEIGVDKKDIAALRTTYLE